MKKLFFLFAVLSISFTASAQTTRVVKGAVIDKNGNPLPGATVTATGGSEVTTVDADGSFSLEVPIWLKSMTAQYAGMLNKKVRIKNGDVIFRMTSKTDRQWFLAGNYSFCVVEGDVVGHMGGLMGGMLGKWGWYGKFNLGQNTYYSEYYNYNNGDYTYDEYKRSEFQWNITAGVTKRIINPLHFYLGFGMGFVPERYDDSGIGVVPEFGLIGKIGNHFLIHTGYQCMVDFDGRIAHGVNVGLGYAF